MPACRVKFIHHENWLPVAKHCVKPCASTLHAVCVKGTYKLVAYATTTNRMFFHSASLLRANFQVPSKLDMRSLTTATSPAIANIGSF